ncbi:MAG: response regulator [Rhodospirillales bacterium]|nr:response regulator [Rhodospirillales bacterium]
MGQLILLAEDNLTNQDVIRRQLTMLGYALEIANDGKEAFELFQSRSFAILMTDCHMPNMDGFELTQAIRKSEKAKGPRFPIIAVTASVMKEEIDNCFSSGMDDYLAKPLEMAKLKDMLRKWMPEPTTSLPKQRQSPLPRTQQMNP